MLNIDRPTIIPVFLGIYLRQIKHMSKYKDLCVNIHRILM